MTGDAVQGTTELFFFLHLIFSILFLLFNHLLHEADVIKLGQVTVFEHVGAFMLGHGLDQVFNNLVRDK